MAGDINNMSESVFKDAVVAVDKISQVFVHRLQSKLAELHNAIG